MYYKIKRENDFQTTFSIERDDDRPTHIATLEWVRGSLYYLTIGYCKSFYSFHAQSWFEARKISMQILYLHNNHGLKHGL